MDVLIILNLVFGAFASVANLRYAMQVLPLKTRFVYVAIGLLCGAFAVTYAAALLGILPPNQIAVIGRPLITLLLLPLTALPVVSDGREMRQRIEELEATVAQSQAVIARLLREIPAAAIALPAAQPSGGLFVLGLFPDQAGVSNRADADAIYNSGLPYRALTGRVDKQRVIDAVSRLREANSRIVLAVGSHGTRQTLVAGQLEGGVVLSDGAIPAGWWRRLVDHYPLAAVVLLACYSDESIGPALVAEGVAVVIAVDQAIDDSAAVAFSTSFWRMVAQGDKLPSAAEAAKLVLDPRQAETIQIYTSGRN